MKKKPLRDPKAQESLLTYLDVTTKMMGQRSLFGFVKDRGRLYTPAAFTLNRRGHAKKMCFMNALHLAMDHPELTYVEGYGVALMPTLHAWCITGEGIVVDPTWDAPERCAYYGIPFDLAFAKQTVFRQQTYGLLSDPETVGLLIDLPPTAYMQKAGK